MQTQETTKVMKTVKLYNLTKILQILEGKWYSPRFPAHDGKRVWFPTTTPCTGKLQKKQNQFPRPTAKQY